MCNVRTLSEVTRRENVRMRTATRVRRVTFDRVVRMEPLALAADAANYGVCMEFGWVGQVLNWAWQGLRGWGKPREMVWEGSRGSERRPESEFFQGAGTHRLFVLRHALSPRRNRDQDVSTKLRRFTARSQICFALSLSMMTMGPPQRGQDQEDGGCGEVGQGEDGAC